MSSTERTIYFAYYKSFISGGSYDGYKTNTYEVRAVRAL